MALCGIDSPNIVSIQFIADASYNSQTDQFIITLIELNATQFGFLNYYLLITTSPGAPFLDLQNACRNQSLYIGFVPTPAVLDASSLNRPQTYTLISPFTKNTTNKITVFPFLRSTLNVYQNSYNYFNATSASLNNNSNVISIVIYVNYSVLSQACLSVLTYYDTVGLQQKFNNAFYLTRILVNSSIPTQTMSAVAGTFFGLSPLYGPNFNKKCVIGLVSYQFGLSTHQTLSFNGTGDGFTNSVSTNNSVGIFNLFCYVGF